MGGGMKVACLKVLSQQSVQQGEKNYDHTQDSVQTRYLTKKTRSASVLRVSNCTEIYLRKKKYMEKW